MRREKMSLNEDLRRRIEKLENEMRELKMTEDEKLLAQLRRLKMMEFEEEIRLDTEKKLLQE